MMTTVVVDCTSARVGVTTLRISERTSLRKFAKRSGCDFHAGAGAGLRSSVRPSSATAFAIVILHIARPSDHAKLNLHFAQHKLAGALGFEPRSSVLETDSLTVELTPLFRAAGLLFEPKASSLRATSFPCG